MEYGQKLDLVQQTARDSLYHNTKYNFERKNKQKIIVDVEFFENNTKFNCKMLSPLIIDKLSNVYLEYFITYGTNPNNKPENMAFVLHFNEFNLNTEYSTNLFNEKKCIDNNFCNGKVNRNDCNINCYKQEDTEKYRSLIIPNQGEKKDAEKCTYEGDDYYWNSTVNHKGFRSNYICSVNPGKLSEISGTLTDAGTNINDQIVYKSPFFNISADNCPESKRVIMELIIENI